jgi:hypothetical protein
MQRLLLFTFFICYSSCIAQEDGTSISRKDFFIGRFTLFQTLDTLSKYLGKADSIRVEFDESIMDSTRTCFYSGITFHSQNREVFDIECITNRFSLPNGIAVGFSKAKVISILGKGTPVDENGRDLLDYSVDSMDNVLILEFDNNKLRQIELMYAD